MSEIDRTLLWVTSDDDCDTEVLFVSETSPDFNGKRWAFVLDGKPCHITDVEARELARVLLAEVGS